jgi:hypothetical protein
MDPNCKTNTHTYMPKRETSFSVKKEKKNEIRTSLGLQVIVKERGIKNKKLKRVLTFYFPVLARIKRPIFNSHFESASPSAQHFK